MYGKKQKILMIVFLLFGCISLFFGSYGLINRIITINDYDVVDAVVVNMHGIVEDFDKGKKWFPKKAVNYTYNGVEYKYVMVYLYDIFIYNGKNVKIQVKIDEPNIARPNIPLMSISCFVIGNVLTGIGIIYLIKYSKRNKQYDHLKRHGALIDCKIIELEHGNDIGDEGLHVICQALNGSPPEIYKSKCVTKKQIKIGSYVQVYIDDQDKNNYFVDLSTINSKVMNKNSVDENKIICKICGNVYDKCNMCCTKCKSKNINQGE